MKNCIGDSTLNFDFGPAGVPVPKPRGEQRAHAAIHPLRLTQPLLRAHGAQDRKLAFLRLAVRRSWLRGRHEANGRGKSLESKLADGELFSGTA
jgi:hypothetical protein